MSTLAPPIATGDVEILVGAPMSYWRTVAWRLRRDPTTIVAGALLVLIALSVVFVPRVVRVAESATVQVKSLEFVAAARASGSGVWPIMRRHLLANVLGPVLVFSSTQVSLSIILAAGLSFLGLGVTPPAAEWGLMLNTLRQSIYVNAVVPALPGLAIFVTSMAFNLLSDGLRDAMEIRA